MYIGGDVVDDEVFGVLFLQSLSVPSSFHFFFFVSKKIDGRVDLSFVLVEGNCEGNRVVDDVEGLSSSFPNEGFDTSCHGASFDSNDFAGLVCRDKDIVFVLGCFSECFSFVLWKVIFDLHVCADSCHLHLVRFSNCGVSPWVAADEVQKEGIPHGVYECVGDDTVLVWRGNEAFSFEEEFVHGVFGGYWFSSAVFEERFDKVLETWVHLRCVFRETFGDCFLQSFVLGLV